MDITDTTITDMEVMGTVDTDMVNTPLKGTMETMVAVVTVMTTDRTVQHRSAEDLLLTDQPMGVGTKPVQASVAHGFLPSHWSQSQQVKQCLVS